MYLVESAHSSVLSKVYSPVRPLGWTIAWTMREHTASSELCEQPGVGFT